LQLVILPWLQVMYERVLQGLGLQEIWCHCGGNGVEPAGERPLS
jgi:hypothetical protein